MSSSETDSGGGGGDSTSGGGGGDVDGGLAHDLDWSLSGLGVDMNATAYNMTEALLALPVYRHSETLENKFQYIMAAPTSPLTKSGEETLTYLNQGQSYEIKLKKLGDVSEYQGKSLRSVVKVCFHERRLQYQESEHFSAWRQARPGERVLNVDIPLSYSIFDVKVPPKENAQNINIVEFLWDPTKETGVFVQVNCFSTEFTPKKHGGEKGVPFRVQIDTYSHGGDDVAKFLHSAYCQIKVFKPKGADRKHKTDRERMEKLSREERDKFQPSYDCTVFSEAPLDTTMHPEAVASSVTAANAAAAAPVASSVASSSSYGLTRPSSSAINTHSGTSPGGGPTASDHVLSLKWSPSKSLHPHPQHHNQPHHHHNVSPTIGSGGGGGVVGGGAVVDGNGNDFGRESPMNSDPDVQSPIDNEGENMTPLNGWTHHNHNPHHHNQQQQQHHQQHHGHHQHNPHHHGHHPPVTSHAGGVLTSSSAGPTSFLGLGLNGVLSSAGMNGHSSVSPSTSFSSTNGDLNASFTQRNGEVDSLLQLQQQQHHHSQQQQPQHSQQQQPQPQSSSPQIPAGLVVPPILSPESSAVVVAAWLVRNRFANYVRVFNNFSGEDLLRLSREDFVQICGLADGIRLDNALQRRHVRPRLTLYVCMENDHVYHPMYLESPSLDEFKAKLGETTGLAPEAVKEMYCQGPSGIHIFVSEQFIANIRDQSRIAVRIVKDENSAKIYVLFRILE